MARTVAVTAVLVIRIVLFLRRHLLLLIITSIISIISIISIVVTITDVTIIVAMNQ